MPLAIPENYPQYLAVLKVRIHQAQTHAALAVNRAALRMYWEIGRDLDTIQASRNWGDKVAERLAHDLQVAFPGVEGFSKRNLERMRAYYRAYPDEALFAAQAVSQIPWGQNILLLQRLKDPELRLWYAAQTLENGWSRPVLEVQIETRLHERQGQALTNFSAVLPAPGSDLAQQILKDPYSFDFLTLGRDAHEREIERGLLEHLKQFLLELGKGFAFLGSQYPLQVEEKDYFLDLLFYHVKLRCYVVIELKNGEFKPEYAGKLNFYLAAVDAQLRHPEDRPSIGLILCRGKSRLTVEYALRGLTTPIGVADFTLTEALPEQLQTELPTVAELEAELEQGDTT